MKEIGRQLIAGAGASVAFLGLYLGASLVWWAALLPALAVYVGAVLLIPRAKEAHEIEIGDGLTKADLERAVRQCRDAAAELRSLAADPKLSEAMAGTLQTLARIVDEIGDNFWKDPRDMVSARGLTDHHLGAVLEVARAYVDLRRSPLLGPEAEARLDRARTAIEGYVGHFQAIYDACLANDFQKLEVSTAALSQILQVEAPVRPEAKADFGAARSDPSPIGTRNRDA